MKNRIMQNRIEIAIVILALVVRLIYLVAFGWENRIYDELWDEIIYWDIGKNLAQGEGFSLSFPIFTASQGPTSLEPPAYPIVIAGVVRLFGESMTAVRVLQAILGALACLIAYRLGHRILGKNAAVLAGFILSLYLPHIMYTRVVQTETLFIFSLALAVWTTLRLLDNLTMFNSAAAGLSWTAAFFTRPEASMFAVAVGLYVLVVLWDRYRKGIVSCLPYVLPGAAIFLAIWSVWIIRNYQVHGAFVPTITTSGMGLWSNNYLRYHRSIDPDRYPPGTLPEFIDVPNFGELTEVERDAALARLAAQFISEQPGTFMYYVLTRLTHAFPLLPRATEFQPLDSDGPYTSGDYTALVEFPLYNTPAERVRVWSFRILFFSAVLGTILALRQRRYGVILLVLLISIAAVRAAAFQGSERARIPVDPYIVMLGAYFLSHLSRISHRRYGIARAR